MAIKRVIAILLLIAPPCLAEELSTTTMSGLLHTGNQNNEYIQYSIPAGDALLTAIDFLANIIENMEDISPASSALTVDIKELIKIAENCKSVDTCIKNCECECDGECECVAKQCSPEQLCDMKAAKKAFDRIDSTNVETLDSTGKFLNLFLAETNATRDVIMTYSQVAQEAVEENPSIGSYVEFRESYDDLVLAKLKSGTILDIIARPLKDMFVTPAMFFLSGGTTFPMPTIEYLKRKTDLTRLQFEACYTPVMSSDDWENVIDGETEYREPVRIDMIVGMGGNLPDEPTNPFDYFCYSYSN